MVFATLSTRISPFWKALAKGCIEELSAKCFWEPVRVHADSDCLESAGDKVGVQFFGVPTPERVTPFQPGVS